MQKKRNSATIALLLVLALAFPASSQSLAALAGAQSGGKRSANADQQQQAGTEPNSPCGPPENPKDKNEHNLDARGSKSVFDISHAKHEQARIIIRNKNPFAYDYTVTVKTERVAEPALGAFLPLLSDFIGGQIKPSDEVTKKAAADKADLAAKARRDRANLARAAPLPPNCTEASELQFERLADDEAGLVADQEGLKQRLDRMSNDRKAIEKDYKEGKNNLENPQAECKFLQKAAKELADKLRAYQIDTKFGQDVADLKIAAKVQERAIRQFQRSYPQCHTETVDVFAAHASTVADTVTDKYSKDYDEIVSGKKTLDEARNTISTILSAPDAFTEVIKIGPFREPTDVSIKVERKLKKPDAKAETVVDAKANFGGGPRFALAGGLVFTNLQKQEFQRVQPAGGGTPILGLKENSNKRLAPLVMLHSRLYAFPRYVDAFHLSVGVTAKNDNKGTDIEYLFGPSLSFAEERLFITAGAYAGKQQRLEGGFQLGSALPTSVSEIPVRKEYHWKFGFAITYKIK